MASATGLEIGTISTTERFSSRYLGSDCDAKVSDSIPVSGAIARSHIGASAPRRIRRGADRAQGVPFFDDVSFEQGACVGIAARPALQIDSCLRFHDLHRQCQRQLEFLEPYHWPDLTPFALLQAHNPAPTRPDAYDRAPSRTGRPVLESAAPDEHCRSRTRVARPARAASVSN